MRNLTFEMLRSRHFEGLVHRLFFRGELPGVAHLGEGQEAIAVGACSALEDGDIVAATYRGHTACLAMGVEPHLLFAELMGRATGVCGGRAGSMNIVDRRHGLVGCFSIVGQSISAATGAALSAKWAGEGAVSLAFFGDGAVNQAYFHESLNFAAIQSLPVVYVCENNQYAEWTRMEAATAGQSIQARAGAYAIPYRLVDGNDVEAVFDVTRDARKAAAEGSGPTLIECLTYRQRGHSVMDGGSYRPSAEVEEWMLRDPITKAEERLGRDLVETLRELAIEEMDEALQFAQREPTPQPTGLWEPLKDGVK